MKNVVKNILKNVVKHLVLSLSALAGVSSGCSLIANPNDHLGGTLEDGGGVDAPSDTGSLDTGVPADTGDGGTIVDAGNDAGSDAGPPVPECTIASDCGTGPVRCVSQRCVFCATPLAAPVAVHSEMGMVRQFGMAVGNLGTTHEVELAYILDSGSSGMSPSAIFTRMSAVSPVAPTGGSSNTLTGIESISSADFDRLNSFDVAAGRFTEGTQGYFDVSVLGARMTNTVRTYVVTGRATLVDSLTYPGADSVAAPAADLAPLRLADVDTVFGGAAVYRARLAGGSIVLRSVEVNYGNQQEEWAAPALPADPYVPIAVASGLIAIGTTDARVALWDLGSAAGVVIPTPGRTGAPGLVEVSAGLYVLAYGAGSRIVLRSIECTGPSSTCGALSASLEIETGAVSIPRVELERSGDVVVLVAYEALAGGMGGQLALRAVRSDLSRVYHSTPTPSAAGDALPIEAFPGGSTRLVTDVHLDLATPAAGTRYVVGWMRSSSPADAIVDLRLQSIGSTCP